MHFLFLMPFFSVKDYNLIRRGVSNWKNAPSVLKPEHKHLFGGSWSCISERERLWTGWENAMERQSNLFSIRNPIPFTCFENIKWHSVSVLFFFFFLSGTVLEKSVWNQNWTELFHNIRLNPWLEPPETDVCSHPNSRVHWRARDYRTCHWFSCFRGKDLYKSCVIYWKK